MSDDLFSTPPPAPKIGEYDLATYRQLLAHLAARGLYLGTSSWKYPGWNGLIYDETRYQYRGKFARTRFEQDCLAEYAETFSSVCVDAGYYQFPAGARDAERLYLDNFARTQDTRRIDQRSRCDAAAR